MPDRSDGRTSKAEAAPLAKNGPEHEASSNKTGHLIQGTADYEDVLDRLSKGVSVPTDMTHLGKK